MSLLGEGRRQGGDAGMFHLSWSVAGQQQIDRQLGAVVDQATDLRPFWNSDEVRDILYGHTKKQFATEGAHGSGGWAELSPAYEAWKAIAYPNRPILQATKALWASLTSPSHPAHVYTATRRTLTFGTEDQVGYWHQKGTRKMKARPPIELTKQERQQIMKELQAYLFHTQGPLVRKHH